MELLTVFNSKGGVGKSTFTHFVVTRFFHMFFKTKKIAVIDFDPQKTTGRKREKELAEEETKETLIKLFPNDYQDRLDNIYDVLVWSYEDFFKNSNSLKKYDYVFLDFPGILDEKIKKILKKVNKIVIPLIADEADIDSTVLFLQFLKSENEKIKCGWFLNRYFKTKFQSYIIDNAHEKFSKINPNLEKILYTKNLIKFGVNEKQINRLVVMNERKEEIRANKSTIIPFETREKTILAILNFFLE